jgi:hypothetical protein
MMAHHKVTQAQDVLAKATSYLTQAQRALAELTTVLQASDDWEGYSQAQHDLRKQVRLAVHFQQVEVDQRLELKAQAEAELVMAEMLYFTVLAPGFRAQRRSHVAPGASQWWVTIGEKAYIIDAGAEAGEVFDEVRAELWDAVETQDLHDFPAGYDSSMLDHLAEHLTESLLARSARTFV